MAIELKTSTQKTSQISRNYQKLNGHRKTLQNLIDGSGITINGNNPWDMKVHNPNTYKRILSNCSLGLGESYMEGWWEAESLDQFFEKLYLAKLNQKAKNPGFLWQVLKSKLFNMQSISRSKQVTKQHYDVGNNLYEKMLGPTMQYTCAYWQEENKDNLEQAQKEKMDLVCRKLQLKPGEKILELGSGFGNFAKFMAENYGVSVTAYNISKEQIKYAREHNNHPNVTFIERDYRSAEEDFKEEYFEKFVSVGLREHIGPKNYKNFVRILHKLTKSDGLGLVHSISKKKVSKTLDPWTKKYIFPNGHIPGDQQIKKSYENRFEILDWHDLINHYNPTLEEWHKRFETAWPELEPEYEHQVNGQFKNMWDYYISSCTGAFKAGALKVTQEVLSKEKISEYKIIR